MKLVIKDWVHVSPGLVSGNGGEWWATEMACTLEGFLLGVSIAEKWGDHRKKNFFINNFVGPLHVSRFDRNF